jgi:hypothetical protein
VNTAYNVPDPLHVSFSGKVIGTDLCRKSTIWNLPMNSGAMIRLSDTGRPQMGFASGGGFGNLYTLDFSKLTDDDFGVIQSFYTTYFFFAEDVESNLPNVGLHRKIYTYLTAFIIGVGQVKITPLVNRLDNPWAPFSTVWNPDTQLWEKGAQTGLTLQQLSQATTHDLEWRLNVRGERVAFKVEVLPLDGATDAFFNMQSHIVVAGRIDRTLPVRGAGA